MSAPIPMIGKPSPGAPVEMRLAWIETMLEKLVQASQASTDVIADAYRVTNAPSPPVRTLDPTTATLADLSKVVATWIGDHRQRGVSGGPG